MLSGYNTETYANLTDDIEAEVAKVPADVKEIVPDQIEDEIEEIMPKIEGCGLGGVGRQLLDMIKDNWMIVLVIILALVYYKKMM